MVGPQVHCTFSREDRPSLVSALGRYLQTLCKRGYPSARHQPHLCDNFTVGLICLCHYCRILHAHYPAKRPVLYRRFYCCLISPELALPGFIPGRLRRPGAPTRSSAAIGPYCYIFPMKYCSCSPSAVPPSPAAPGRSRASESIRKSTDLLSFSSLLDSSCR